MKNSTEEIMEHASTNGTFLRPYVVRPPCFFFFPADIRWMLALTAPRVLATIAYYDRTLGLDDTVFTHTNTVLAKALQGGKQLTRDELASVLQQAGIATDNLQRTGHVLMHAELDGIIC